MWGDLGTCRGESARFDFCRRHNSVKFTHFCCRTKTWPKSYPLRLPLGKCKFLIKSLRRLLLPVLQAAKFRYQRQRLRAREIVNWMHFGVPAMFACAWYGALCQEADRRRWRKWGAPGLHQESGVCSHLAKVLGQHLASTLRAVQHWTRAQLWPSVGQVQS